MAEEFPNQTLVAEGFEDAFIGYAWCLHRPPLAIYDRKKAQRVLMRMAGMTEEEADEYLQYHVESDWKGEGTPVFLNRCSIEEFLDWSTSE